MKNTNPCIEIRNTKAEETPATRRGSDPLWRLTRGALLALCLLGLNAGRVHAADPEYAPVALERATDPAGPWATAPVTSGQLTPDGALLMPTQIPHEFWRLRITPAGQLGFPLGLPLSNAPAGPRKIANDFLVAHTLPTVADPAVDPPEPDHMWRQARLADTVIPVYDAGIDGGRTPAYLEFKVIAADPPPTTGPFRHTPGPLDHDQGFILVSLTENTFPVADWSNEGETRVEQLRRRAGTAPVKPLLFGTALMVGEEPGGTVRATDSTPFLRPHPGLLNYSNFVGSGEMDTSTGVSNRSPDLPLAAPLQPYASYAEMKADYETNEFFARIRASLKNEARLHWMIENGTPPPPLRVTVGRSLTILAGRDVTAARLDTTDDEVVIARLAPRGTEGLVIDGLAPGDGVLHVQVEGSEELFLLYVVAEGGAPKTAAANAGFTPGWRTTRTYAAGTKADQHWYSQFQSPDFGGGGNFVGCGPIAWSLLTAWWDTKGVPVLFKPYYYGSGLPNWWLGLPDAPFEKNDAYVDAMTRMFRTKLDPLVCEVVSGNCATLPGNMSGGFSYFEGLAFIYNLVYQPFLPEPLLGYSYQYLWTAWPKNGDNEYNRMIRASLKKGRPSIMGQGWLSHYVLAYAYIEERFEVQPGVFLGGHRAWVRANWGWGKNTGAKNYNYADTMFFATNARFWQTATEYQP